jgi:tetratricopeptide (TPR) repeat protein
MPVDVAQAAAALARDRPAEARPILEAATRADARDAMAWALLAQTYLRLKQPAQAAAAARRAEPAADPKVGHALAVYYAQSGNRKRAAQLETQFARSAEADRFAASRAAMLHFESGNAAAAIEMGELALKQDERAGIRLLLARAYEAGGRMDDALVQRRELVRTQPYSEEAHAELGKLCLRMGRFADASRFLEEARTSFDKSPQIELALGVAYYSLRRFDDAAARFLRVISLAPDVEQPYVFLARMIDQIPARIPELLPLAAEWRRRETKNHYAPFVYGKVLLASGEVAAAVRPLFEEAIRRQPRFWESYFEYAQVLEQQGHLKEAAAQMKTAITLNPKQAAPHYRLARLYDRLGQKRLAEQERALHAKLLEAEKARPGMADPAAN